MNMAGTQQGWRSTKSTTGAGVQSVTGLNTDNTDPLNPIVEISVDGITITGDGTPLNPLQASSNTNQGFYSQTAISTTIVNTIVETSIIGAGVGTLSVPANSFNVGDSFVAKIGGEITNVNNTNIRFKLKSLGVTLVDTGFIQLKLGTNQFWQLDVNFVIRSIGGVGVASILSNGNFTHIRNNTGVEVFGFNTLNSTTFSTTILNTLDITAQWQTADPSNSIHSDFFCLNKVF
jgi:hypothetical protein